MKHILVKALATGLYTGYARLVPGTVGTVPAWLLAYFFLGESIPMLAAATVITTVASVWLAGEAEGLLGHDSRKIVIDEWAGMFLTLLFVPFSLTNYVIAFVAFRVFDVVKIPPAAQAERLPRGWGVTTDDVVAGIQAGITSWLVVYLIERYS